MKISARNVFEGTITAIKAGPINAEVEVTLSTGEILVAGITEGSVQSLGISIGTRAVTIVKAPLVLLATDTAGWKFSARNQFAGTVAAIQIGAVNTSVSVTLPGGATLSSIVTSSAVEELGLAVGNPVTALFKAGSVVLGLATA